MCITVNVVSRQWDKVEDKYAVATIGVAAIVALWTVVGAIKVHDQDKHTLHVCLLLVLRLIVQIHKVTSILFSARSGH